MGITAVRTPECYGILLDEDTEDCQCCLIREACGDAMGRPKVAIGDFPDTVGELPKDKKRLILVVCRKYGISTRYWSKRYQEWYEITEENLDDWVDLSFLLCSKEALTKLALAQVE